MTANRRPARLTATDSAILCAATTLAFACFIAPYYPNITQYDLWTSTAKALVMVNGIVWLAFSAGYWFRGRR